VSNDAIVNHKDWINGPRAVVWGVGHRSAILSAEADTAKAPSPTAKWVIVLRKAGLVVLLGMDTGLRFLLLTTKREVSGRDLIPKN
tara:strand:- start:869 stop:1126 length:258 start_codon:yes stop_codon:yes gene_type:complete